jgi:hypothetical protein
VGIGITTPLTDNSGVFVFSSLSHLYFVLFRVNLEDVSSHLRKLQQHEQADFRETANKIALNLYQGKL